MTLGGPRDPSPVPLRLVKAPAAGHPLPRGEGWDSIPALPSERARTQTPLSPVRRLGLNSPFPLERGQRFNSHYLANGGLDIMRDAGTRKSLGKSFVRTKVGTLFAVIALGFFCGMAHRCRQACSASPAHHRDLAYRHQDQRPCCGPRILRTRLGISGSVHAR